MCCFLIKYVGAYDVWQLKIVSVAIRVQVVCAPQQYLGKEAALFVAALAASPRLHLSAPRSARHAMSASSTDAARLASACPMLPPSACSGGAGSSADVGSSAASPPFVAEKGFASLLKCHIAIVVIENLARRLAELKEAAKQQAAAQLKELEAAPVPRGSVAEVWSDKNVAAAVARRRVRDRHISEEVIALVETRLEELQHRLVINVEEEEKRVDIGLSDAAEAEAEQNEADLLGLTAAPEKRAHAMTSLGRPFCLMGRSKPELATKAKGG